MRTQCIISTLSVLASVFAAPSLPSGTVSAPTSTQTVPYASDDPNYPLWNDSSDITPEAIRGSLGATVIGPQNVELDLQNTDALAPPTTDNGNMCVAVIIIHVRRRSHFCSA